MSQKQKINWLLILQGWAMLWVVIGHSVMGEPETAPALEKALFDFAYSFHMPLFIFISGYLFNMTRLSRDSGYGYILKDKAIRLLIPGAVFSLLALGLKFAFPGEMSRQASFEFSYFLHIYLFPYDNPLRELWFLVTLMWLFAFAPLWKITLKKDWAVALTILLLALLSLRHPATEFLCLGRVIEYAIWFYLGIVFSSGLALLLDRCLPKTFFTFRNYTYQIFLMGIFAQMVVKIVYRHIECPRILAYAVCIAAGLYIPVLISLGLKKTGSKPLLKCVGLTTI